MTLPNFEKPAVTVSTKNLVPSTYAPHLTVAVAILHPGTHVYSCTLSKEKFRNVGSDT